MVKNFFGKPNKFGQTLLVKKCRVFIVIFAVVDDVLVNVIDHMVVIIVLDLIIVIVDLLVIRNSNRLQLLNDLKQYYGVCGGVPTILEYYIPIQVS